MPGVCARCRREVYFAEERLALGKVWHTFCFSCLNCRKLLDSCTVSTHRGELFCRNCYSRLFPSILRSTKENNSSKDIKTFPRSTILNTPISVKDSTCCHCCCYCATEDTPIGEASSINSKDYHSKKHRLRGGGEEEEKSQSRSRSPPCRTVTNGDCCCDNVTCCDIDGIDSCCKVKLPPGCECLGGGLDCQRCGRKVYQAEMQIASGVPYHNICFSCFCCRKPLEPLTYQESCGEIYCKQCYIRNFGPQGYGYGMGAGALQTPM